MNSMRAMQDPNGDDSGMPPQMLAQMQNQMLESPLSSNSPLQYLNPPITPYNPPGSAFDGGNPPGQSPQGGGQIGLPPNILNLVQQLMGNAGGGQSQSPGAPGAQGAQGSQGPQQQQQQGASQGGLPPQLLSMIQHMFAGQGQQQRPAQGGKAHGYANGGNGSAYQNNPGIYAQMLAGVRQRQAPQQRGATRSTLSGQGGSNQNPGNGRYFNYQAAQDATQKQLAASAAPKGPQNVKDRNAQLMAALQQAFSGIQGGTTPGAVQSDLETTLGGQGWSKDQLAQVDQGVLAAEPHGLGFYEQGKSAQPFIDSFSQNIMKALGNG